VIRLRYTNRFQRAYTGLTAENTERVKKALRLLVENPRHPSLHVRRIQGTEGIWEARAGLSIRLTFEMHGDLILLRNVGAHDEALKKP